jgi:hypothetical protein
MPAKTARLQSVRFGLFWLLAALACSTMHAQEPGPAPKLLISILDGEGALNDIHQRTAREPIVEVQDENHKPIAGAVVLFTLPGSGPGGFFANGAQTFSTVTDAEGRAVGTGLQPNSVQGSYDIHVTASYHGAKAETTIHQKNVVAEPPPPPPKPVVHGISAKTWLIIAGSAAVAGTVAAIVATRGGSSSTITAGVPTVGPPPTAGASIRIQLHGHSR